MHIFPHLYFIEFAIIVASFFISLFQITPPNRNCLYCAISSAEWNVNMRATLTGSRKNLIYASKLFYQKLINGKISIPLLRSTCFSSVGEPAIFFFYPVLMSNVNNRSYATEGYFLENKTTNELTNLVKWRHISFFQ